MRGSTRRPGRDALTGSAAHDALASARQAHQAVPDDPEPVFLLCSLLLARRDPEANALLPKLEQFPDFGPGWEELGNAMLSHHPAAARMAFRRAASAYASMEQRSPGADIAFRLGLMLRRTGDLVAAAAAMERATDRDPGAAKAWFTLGLLRQDLSETHKAVTAFRAALAAQPDFHEAAFNLGVACQESRDMEAALDAYATAWRLRPDSFGRIAQALVSPATGRLWLRPSALKQDLSARA